MRAGKLIHLIEIQSPIETTDAAGGPIPTWDEQTPYAQLYASVQPLRGREIIAAGTDTQTTHKITTRYKAGITTDMRIKFGERYFGIDSVINVDERNVMLEIMAVEGRVQGR
jgi:SPP1 family predicted phage head-tail adaptor